MTFRSFAAGIGIVFSSLFFCVSIHAQGVIVPIICDVRPCQPIRPVPVPLPNALPVKSIKIDTKIDGQVATTHLEQIFRNDTRYTLEGTYFFPIPEQASVVEFAIWENGKKLVGEVRSREEARRIYNEIVRRQRDPGLLEYAGKDLFQASIFPIPPNSDKKLEMTYTEVLKSESGTVSYRYPLGTGRNVWEPRRPRPTWDEDMRGGNQRQDPVQKFGTISGSIEIRGKEALRNIYSPTHEIDVKRKGENVANISFETKTSNSDFQLFYGTSNSDLGMSLITYREPGKDGYFLLMLSPKSDTTEKELINKDVVFVLDTSGSMADEGKMDKAKKALQFGIKTLRDGDRFNVISFAGEEHLMERGLIAADSLGKRRGTEFVEKLRPTGGTNINDALIASIKQFDTSDRPKMLVFMTDGLPTVGETNVEKIIKNSREVKADGVRMFTFGVGYDVNTSLLDRLATENHGVADYIEPKEDLEQKVSTFFTKVTSPVLTDIDLDFGSVRTDLTYPRQNPDIFRGSQLTIIGRYTNSNELDDITVRLTGKAGKEARTFNYTKLNFPERNEENDFLPRLWATRRVGWLVEQIRNNGENTELKKEIIDLGTKYGIVTPYTSYLATDGSEGGPPNGMDISSRRDAASPRATQALSANSGSVAVEVSKQVREQKEKVSLAGEMDDSASSASIKKIGIKTFYLDGGVWTDSEFRPDSALPDTTLKFASEAYFELVTKEREIGQYLSLGERVTIVWKGRVYRITS